MSKHRASLTARTSYADLEGKSKKANPFGEGKSKKAKGKKVGRRTERPSSTLMKAALLGTKEDESKPCSHPPS
jgi:hypothetical protein